MALDDPIPARSIGGPAAWTGLLPGAGSWRCLLGGLQREEYAPGGVTSRA